MPSPDALIALAERVEAGEIKALSIKQPYPHYIFHGGKDVENRDWPTRVRGWVLIHAGLSKSEIDDDEAHLPRGGIVGAARIVDCVETMESRWFFGRYGFVLRDAFPIPLVGYRGSLGFFSVALPECREVGSHIRALAQQEGRDDS